ncbi:UNVERIFIED_CONTAM: hypothetical protein K2H54_024675 [Gekko kuhli]
MGSRRVGLNCATEQQQNLEMMLGNSWPLKFQAHMVQNFPVYARTEQHLKLIGYFLLVVIALIFFSCSEQYQGLYKNCAKEMYFLICTLNLLEAISQHGVGVR